MNRPLATMFAAVIALCPQRVLARGGFSDGELSVGWEWVVVTLIYMPVALVFAGCLAIVTAISFGKRVEGRVKLAGFPALVSAGLAMLIYCAGTATLILVKH